MQYRWATEVSSIASELMDTVHKHVRRKHVRCVFAFDPEAKNRPESWGKVVKIGKHQAWLATLGWDEKGRGAEFREADEFFLLVVEWACWRFMSDKQKRAFVDELLSSCDYSDTGKLVVGGYDLAAHSGVIARHGVQWRSELKAAWEIASRGAQLELIPDPVTATEVIDAVVEGRENTQNAFGRYTRAERANALDSFCERYLDDPRATDAMEALYTDTIERIEVLRSDAKDQDVPAEDTEILGRWRAFYPDGGPDTITISSGDKSLTVLSSAAA